MSLVRGRHPRVELAAIQQPPISLSEVRFSLDVQLACDAAGTRMTARRAVGGQSGATVSS